jgi:hypothetical protein
MTKPTDDRQLARDVAKQLDRRRIKRKMGLWTALFGLIAAAALYVRCGDGFGLGGGGRGPGGGDDSSRRVASSGLRCAIRLTASGIAVDGKKMSRDQAVHKCADIGGAYILVTGDARHGDKDELLDALRAAGIKDIKVDEAHAPTAGSAAR